MMYPTISPFLCSGRGGFQERYTDCEEVDTAEKFCGGALGATNVQETGNTALVNIKVRA